MLFTIANKLKSVKKITIVLDVPQHKLGIYYSISTGARHCWLNWNPCFMAY